MSGVLSLLSISVQYERSVFTELKTVSFVTRKITKIYLISSK